MDCRTARMLFDFARPRCAELHASESDALRLHLEGCPDCDLALRVERQSDARLGDAMRAVTVPNGLHLRLLQRLAAERNTWQRRWARRGAAVAAVAASLFLVLLLALHSRRPALDVDGLSVRLMQQTAGDPETVRAWFQEVAHLDVIPPPQFKYYQQLCWYGVEEHQNRRIPLLIFSHHGEHGISYAYAYVLSDKDFDLSGVPIDEQSKGVLNSTRLEGARGTSYLVFYTGGTLKGFYAE